MLKMSAYSLNPHPLPAELSVQGWGHLDAGLIVPYGNAAGRCEPHPDVTE